MARILIVDDDPDFLDGLRLLLENAQFDVDTAMTPEEGIGKVKSGLHDLLILDVMMPDGHEGFDVARTIREQLKLRDLPIVILSAIHERKQIPYRFAPDEHYLPVDVFLDKPVDNDTLLAVIAEILGEGREVPEHPL